MTTTDATWRDYTLEQTSDFGVAVLCRSDDMCMDAEMNAPGRYLTLGEAVDWAEMHIAQHARLDAVDDAEENAAPAVGTVG